MKKIVIICLSLVVIVGMFTGIFQLISSNALESDDDLVWTYPIANFGEIVNNTTYSIEELYFPMYFNSSNNENLTFHVICPTGHLYGYTLTIVTMTGEERDFPGGHLWAIYNGNVVDENRWAPDHASYGSSFGLYAVIDRERFTGGNLTIKIQGEGLFLMLYEDIRDSIGYDGVGSTDVPTGTVAFSLPWEYTGGPESKIPRTDWLGIHVSAPNKFDIYVYDNSMHLLYKECNVTHVDISVPVSQSYGMFITLKSDNPNSYNMKFDVAPKPCPGLALIVFSIVLIFVLVVVNRIVREK